MPFNFVQDNTDKLNAIKVGQTVTISYNLKGRKWQDRWFPDIQGWKIETNGGALTPQKPAMAAQEAAFEADTSDLPF